MEWSRKDWLKLVAVHSDAWLLAVAFFYGAKLNKMHRCVPPRHPPFAKPVLPQWLFAVQKGLKSRL